MGINNNIRCFEMLNLKDLAQLSRMINNNIRCFEMQCTKIRAQKQQRINNNIRCFEINKNIREVMKMEDKQ